MVNVTSTLELNEYWGCPIFNVTTVPMSYCIRCRKRGEGVNVEAVQFRNTWHME